jgi:hypothetical protein
LAASAAVETLAIGDLVLTADGRCVPVKWIGRQAIVTRFGLRTSHTPIVIEAGALGDGLPHRDLRLTSAHALVFGDIAVEAGALVNGTTIRRIPRADLGERFTVFHIETERHEVILANGSPAETFVDNATRQRFDNFAEYRALHGDETPIEEPPLPRLQRPPSAPRPPGTAWHRGDIGAAQRSGPIPTVEVADPCGRHSRRHAAGVPSARRGRTAAAPGGASPSRRRRRRRLRLQQADQRSLKNGRWHDAPPRAG